MTHIQHFAADALANSADPQAPYLKLSRDGGLSSASFAKKPDAPYELACFSNTLSEEDFNTLFNQLEANVSQAYLKPIAGTQAIAIYWPLAEQLDDSIVQKLHTLLAGKGVEIWQLNRQRPSLAKPGLLLMDMDSTTIKIECIDEIAKLAGVGEQVAKVTELAMQGKLDFSESLRARVATLKDAPVSIIEQVAHNLPLMHGLENLIAQLKAAGWKIAIASGGFTYFADRLKGQLGLDAAYANQLEISADKLTGQVKGDIVDAQVKADTLLKLAQEYNIAESQTVAMGDGANDLVMMSAAALGVAFEAKPLVQARADVAVNYHGLDSLLAILKDA